MAATKGKSRFNPRGGDRRGKNALAQRPSSSLWYVLALVLLLGVVQMYYMTPTGRSRPYSEFNALVKSGQVGDVSIGDTVIRGTLTQAPANDKANKQFTTTRVEDPKLTE
jgi:hypothetical protein